MLKVVLRAGPKSYPVYLGRHLIEKLGIILAGHLPACSLLLVSDRNVCAHYAEGCLQSLKRGGFEPHLEVLHGGESDKSLDVAARIYSKALAAGLDRRSAIVALGGGVVGDLAGFVAATYLRGIPYVQVPTTLLAMIDSSVGGKVAVNHPLAKNIIGAFYQPTAVLSDVATLATLPGREFKAGLAELVKYGVIWDGRLFERLEKIFFRNGHFNSRELVMLIAASVAIKGKIVFLDEREEDLRRILNFGHTFGHALEAATGYRHYLHGEAVACGMAMAARLSACLGRLDRPAEKRIVNIVKKLNPPGPPAGLTVHSVMKALLFDKKKEREELIFILPEEIGRVSIYRSPPEHLVSRVIEEFLGGEIIQL